MNSTPIPCTGTNATLRLTRLVREAAARVNLDLTDRRVLTEAATGAYVTTAAIAALAGARVTALAKDSRYGSAAQAKLETERFAANLGVSQRVTVVTALEAKDFCASDIVTNSGHLRPLDRDKISQMKPGAVISLMYEAWEYRASDVDLNACREFQIKVAGTNESHPNVGVLEYVGLAAIYGMIACKVPPPFTRVLVVAGNRFAPYIVRSLLDVQAQVEVLSGFALPDDIQASVRAIQSPAGYDAVIVAEPGDAPVIGSSANAKYKWSDIGSCDVLVQIYGDIERATNCGIQYYPAESPAAGHMGVNLCELGPDPVVRLAAGSLKVGEILASAQAVNRTPNDYCDYLPCYLP